MPSSAAVETELAIELGELVKVYGRGADEVLAVDRLDLRVERGVVFGLLGPNGAGKTTTVEICEGLLAPTSGIVRVLGEEWRGSTSAALKQRIGVSLQETHFFPKQTVGEILTLFASFYDDARPVDEVIALVSLEEKQNTRSRQLSGGQRQRLAVATALVGRPDLLFLDEPTTGLDPQSRLQLWDVIREFRRAGGTVLLTTHNMEEAEQLCDRLAIVDHGHRIAMGSPKDLIASLGGEHVIEIEADGLAEILSAADAAGLPGVNSQRRSGDMLTFTVDAPHRALPPLLDRLGRQSVELEHLATRHTSLEDVFVSLTGRHLRDDD